VSVKGVLCVGSDTSNRIPGATITLHDGRTITTTSTGFWQFTGVPVGEFTVSAAKSGYETRSITRPTDDAETWASFSLSPVLAGGTAVLQGVVYHGPSSLDRIPGASLSLSTGPSITADANGFYRLTGLAPGAVTITASAAGYTSASVSRDLENGTTTWGSVQLAP
jgi:hypothetical protein